MRSPKWFILYGRVRRVVNGDYWYMMIFWEVLLERFVGKLCGGCCGAFGESGINVTKRHQWDEK